MTTRSPFDDLIEPMTAPPRDATDAMLIAGTKAWAEPFGTFARVWRAMYDAAPAPPAAQPVYTTGHCKENAKKGGCQLHNLHCGWPECDRRLAAPPVAQPAEPLAPDDLVQRLRKCYAHWGTFPECVEAADAIAALRAERDALECANASLNVEVDRLYACRNELQEVTRTMNDPTINIIHTLNEAVHSLRAERDALREDAERYRWLRDEAPPDWVGWAEERDAAEATAPEVDAAIDRARNVQSGGQERSSVGRTDVVAGSSPAASVSPDPAAAPATPWPGASPNKRNDTAAPAQGEPQPVAWVRADHLRQMKYAPFMCRLSPAAHDDTCVPLYSADAIAALRAEPPAPDACICSQACIHYMDALSLVQRQAREIAKLERLPTDGGHTRALRAEAERDALADALDYLRGLTPEQYSTLRADAERYRHIRDYPMSPELHRIITLQQNTLWDAAIDAAREGK